jgi:hypothetical protein
MDCIVKPPHEKMKAKLCSLDGSYLQAIIDPMIRRAMALAGQATLLT